MKSDNADGLVKSTDKKMNVVASPAYLLTVRSHGGFYKCSDCGHEDHYSEVDLWTRCNDCFGSLITDVIVNSLDEIDPI